MAILFSSETDDPEPWRTALAAHFEDLDFRVWPDDDGDPADVEFALVWLQKEGALKHYPNLRAIFSLGAGVEHILRDSNLPAGVPIVRLVDIQLTRDMTEYVLAWVLYYHRDHHRYRTQQAARQWRTLPPVVAADRQVGILGLGELGRASASALAGLGFRVRGWSRTAKEIEGVACFDGAGGLGEFLEGVEILICLLPLTPETRGIVDDALLAALPAGACFINAARGGHMVTADLVAALASGHIAGATLDVFEPEPLPAADPLWSHPGVNVTPHVASITYHKTAAAEIVEDIRRIRDGGRARHIVDPAKGY